MSIDPGTSYVIGTYGTYAIGAVVWLKGTEYTIRTEPYTLHGGLFQSATDASGREISVPTPKEITRWEKGDKP